jgi:hypothetical protein
MKIENMEFIEALEFLAVRAHIDLKKYISSTYSSKEDNRD